MTFSVLLIAPPVFDFYYTPARKEPLGLLYLKMAAEAVPNVSVTLYDSQAHGRKKKQKPPQELSYLQSYYVEDYSAFSLFQNYFRFGDSFNKIINHITENRYDLIAISSLFSAYHPDVENLIENIKKVVNAPVVVGGWAVEAEQESLFKESRADYFLTGGLENFTDFIRFICNGNDPFHVEGLLYRKNGEVIKNKNDKPFLLPESFPKREHTYFFKGKRIAKTVLSTGCSYKCDFCSIHRLQTFSHRSLSSIEKELKYLQNIGVEIVDFEDDNLFYDNAWSKEFLKILEQFHNQGMNFMAMNGMTASNLIRHIDAVLDAGFIELNLSMVTSNKTVSQEINRPEFSRIIDKIARKSSDRSELLVFLILGLPRTTVDDVLCDINMLSQLPVKIGVSPLYLLPGVPLLEKLGMPDNRRLLRGSALYRFYGGFSREDIVSMWKYVRMINYLNEADAPDDEQIYYFHKSLDEKKWYAQKKDGTWYPYLAFEIAFPKIG